MMLPLVLAVMTLPQAEEDNNNKILDRTQINSHNIRQDKQYMQHQTEQNINSYNILQDRRQWSQHQTR